MAIQERLYTVNEFEAFIALPDHADRLFELIDGEIVEKLPTEEHSLVIGNVYMPLRLFVDPRGLGRVAFEVRRKIVGDDHNARLPDVEFTSTARLLPVVKKVLFRRCLIWRSKSNRQMTALLRCVRKLIII